VASLFFESSGQTDPFRALTFIVDLLASVPLSVEVPIASRPCFLADPLLQFKELRHMRIYVGNLSFNTSESDLHELFSQVGAVESCRIITDRDTGRSRGFGFVEMGSKDEGQNAITRFSGQEIGGRALTVNEAKPQEPRRDGGGGGGSRGGGRGGFSNRW
jgi:RNA recognition motif-containing protein